MIEQNIFIINNGIWKIKLIFKTLVWETRKLENEYVGENERKPWRDESRWKNFSKKNRQKEMKGKKMKMKDTPK